MAHVNTVLGAIHPDELGPTATHEHIVWGPPGWEYDPEWWFHYPQVFAKCLVGLVEYRELGGRSIMCCSGIGLGRDVEFYRMLSKYSGVNIVVPTGFWAAAGIPNHFIGKSIDYLSDMFVRELTDGIGNTGVRPGFIKVGIGRTMTAGDEMLHRAAARAAKRAGVPVVSHGAWEALKVLEILASEGMDLSLCVVERVGEDARDEMTVMVEVIDPGTHGAAVRADLERRLKEVIGVRVTVSPVAPRALDPYTGTSQTSKIKRLLDKRR